MLRLTPDGGVRFEGSGDGPDSQPPRKLETRHTAASSQDFRAHLVNEIETLVEPLGSGESVPTAQQFSPEELEKIGSALERMRQEQDFPETPPPTRKQLDPMQDEVQLGLRRKIQELNAHAQAPGRYESHRMSFDRKTIQEMTPAELVANDILFFVHRLVGKPWLELREAYGTESSYMEEEAVFRDNSKDTGEQQYDEAASYRQIQNGLRGIFRQTASMNSEIAKRLQASHGRPVVTSDASMQESHHSVIERHGKQHKEKAEHLLQQYGGEGLRFHILPALLAATRTDENPQLPRLLNFRPLNFDEHTAIERIFAQNQSISAPERTLCFSLLKAWNDHFSGIEEVLHEKYGLCGLPDHAYQKLFGSGIAKLENFIPARLVDTNGVHSELLYTKYVHIPDGTELTLTNTSSLEQGEGTELILPPDYLGETELHIKLVSKNGRIAFYFPANTEEVKDTNTWKIGATTVHYATSSEAPDYRALQIQAQHGTLTLELHPRGVTLSMKRKTSP